MTLPTPRPPGWWIFSGRHVLLRDDLFGGREPAEATDPRPAAPFEGTAAAADVRMAVPRGAGLVSADPPGEGDHDPAQLLLAGERPSAPPGFRWVDLRAAASVLDTDAFRRAGRAWQLLEWRRSHRFCGVCGSPTAPGPYDALTCTVCDHLHFPRLSPAVIVLVHDGDRVLLGRSGHLPEGMYSTLAGFVEPGESLEETVHREIREEADVEVTDLRYFGSQPWPFPHSLMVGFFARWAGGTPRPADGELEAVDWFHRDALPRIPGRVSIARSLIDAWLGSARGGTPGSSD